MTSYSVRSNGYESLLTSSTDIPMESPKWKNGKMRRICAWILFAFFVFLTSSTIGLLLFRASEDKWVTNEVYPEIQGVTSIFTAVAMKTLVSLYTRDKDQKVTVRRQTTEDCLSAIFNGTVDFAVVEGIPPDSQLNSNEIQVIPLFGVALEVVVNVPELTSYTLTMDLLAGIYGGHPWNIADESLTKLNPFTPSATQKIDAIHFTTQTSYGIDRIFPNILCAHSPDEWMSCNNASKVQWPTEDGVFVNSDGVILTLVSNLPYSFGYVGFGQEIPSPAVSVSFLLEDGVSIVSPTTFTIENSIQKTPFNVSGPTRNFKPQANCSDCWPITTLSYLLFRKSSLNPFLPFVKNGTKLKAPYERNCSSSRGLTQFIKWIYEEDLKEFRMQENLVGMPTDTSAQILKNLSELSECKPFGTISRWVAYAFGIGFGAVCLLIILLILFAFIRSQKSSEKTPLLNRENLRRMKIESVMVQNDEELIIDGEEIGRGTFSTVYKGKFRETQVAVKKINMADLKRRGLGDSESIETLEREVEMMSTLRHPNIVLFLFACMKPDYCYIVSEYCNRGSLYNIIHDEEIDLDEQLQIRLSLDAARGMLHLHSSKIIHRDLKTSNLLVDKDWNLKVTDFGISISVVGQRMMTGNCGTVEYMAPECLKNEPYTEKCDVFSFGIVLSELYSRSGLYPGLSVVQIRYMVRTQEMRPQLNSFVPQLMKELIVDCWQTNPDLRPSFADIVTRLTEMSNTIQQSPTKSKPKKTPFSIRDSSTVDLSVNAIYRGSV
eukprot:TRINITY_DN6479_c0_g1_i1.p1 TRINITY_DN6479_c0_g1~~TRINITY_DN6479_c0_g1_i1.p1  ORF type:complete len:774 (-),score=219.35 TRINITY_DN6479_c0_g1_i1:117-2438(-)